MSEEKFSDTLANEEILRNLIKDAIKTICEKDEGKYPTICKLASRSAQDKHNLVEKTFELMSKGNQLGLEEALSQANGMLNEE